MLLIFISLLTIGRGDYVWRGDEWVWQDSESDGQQNTTNPNPNPEGGKLNITNPKLEDLIEGCGDDSDDDDIDDDTSFDTKANGLAKKPNLDYLVVEGSGNGSDDDDIYDDNPFETEANGKTNNTNLGDDSDGMEDKIHLETKDSHDERNKTEIIGLQQKAESGIDIVQSENNSIYWNPFDKPFHKISKFALKFLRNKVLDPIIFNKSTS